MQPVLERGSIDIPLTFDGGLIQLSFIPACSPNTCNISVKLCRGFALLCFSLFYVLIPLKYSASKILGLLGSFIHTPRGVNYIGLYI